MLTTQSTPILYGNRKQKAGAAKPTKKNAREKAHNRARMSKTVEKSHLSEQDYLHVRIVLEMTVLFVVTDPRFHLCYGK